MKKVKAILNRILALVLVITIMSGCFQEVAYAAEIEETESIETEDEEEAGEIPEVKLEVTLESPELVFAYDEEKDSREQTKILSVTLVETPDEYENLYFAIKASAESEETILEEAFSEDTGIELDSEDFPKGNYAIQFFCEYENEDETLTISSEVLNFQVDYEKREYPVNKSVNWTGRLDSDQETTFADIQEILEEMLLEDISDWILTDAGEKETTGNVSINDAQGNVVNLSDIVSEGKYQLIFSLDDPGVWFYDTAEAELNLSFEPYDYKITYVLNGGENSTDNPSGYYKGSEVTFSEPVRNGYKFQGWYLDSSYKKPISQIVSGTVGNKKLYAKWSKEKYTITYFLDEGKNNSSNPKTYDVTTSTIKLKTPTKKGYTFLGWYTDENFTTQVTTIPKGSYGNVELYAKWELTEYTITYSMGTGAENSENNPTSYNILSESITTLEDPNRNGFIFKGWYTDSKYKKKFKEIPDGSTGNKTIYAKWSAIKYTISYELNEGKNDSKNPKTYYATTSTIKLKTPTRKGYTFLGWYTDEEFTTQITEIPKGSYGDLTLYAKWELTEYTITYSMGSGAENSENNPTSYNMLSESITTLGEPSRNGFIFKGWYADSKYKTKFKQIAQGSTGNKTIYAKWSAIKYTISYELNEGKNDSKNPKTYYATTSTIKLKTPTRKGYTFLGWYTDEEFATQITEIPKGSWGNLTLYAKWELTEYTITYSMGSGAENNEANPLTYTMLSESITTLEEPSRNGFVFKGWYTDSKYKTKFKGIPTGSTGNKTIYAKWSAIKYTIAYNLDGGTNNSKNPKSYYITTSTITLKTPTKKGYTFLGWYTDETFETSITTIPKGSYENFTLYAKWELTEYTITYIGLEDAEIVENPTSYNILTPTFVLNNPTKEDYTFKGWYSDSSYKTKVTKIAQGSTGNKKLYAKWVINIYTVKFDGNGAASGSVSSLVNCKCDVSYTLPSNSYKRLWYTFTGWNTKKDGSGTSYKNKASIKNPNVDKSGVLTLYAQWEKKFDKKGVDVSQYQGTINWSKVKADGIDFAMIRILKGTTSSMSVDSKFETNYTNARKAGINVGVYRYCYATTTSQARQEAKKVLEVLDGRKLDYPIVLDVEDASLLTGVSSNSRRSDIVLAFKEVIEDAGYKFALYANLDWLNNYLDMDKLSSVDIWLARWRSVSSGPGYTGKGKLRMWQYSGYGTVDGISGYVDLNISY